MIKQKQMRCIGYQNNFMKYRDILSKQVIKGEFTQRPLISVVIPTYKKNDMLKVTLDSVINQRGNFIYEIVIVNDNPEDNELEDYLRKLRANNINYYVNEKNLGLFGNWNRCIELAKGKWVCLLNDDDLLYPDYMSKVTDLLKKNKNIDYLYSAHDVIHVKNSEHVKRILEKHSRGMRKNDKVNEKEERLYQNGPLLSRIHLPDFFFEHQITHPLGQLMKKDYLIKLGGYNEGYYPSSDWVLNFNYCLNWNMYYYNDVIGCRTEGINVSARKDIKIKFIEQDYRIRREIAGYFKLPGKEWYTKCFMGNYAKLLGVSKDIKVKEIRDCTITELELQKVIMHLYIKIRNLLNHIEYNLKLI